MLDNPSERKLTTIVAADIAGFSRLASVNEEKTVSQLHAHRQELIDPAIENFRGRIANTSGDGLLIEFQSVVDALRWAVFVQQEMVKRNSSLSDDERLCFRIGINVGDVIVSGGDLLGDGVNVAARIEGLALPGGICLSGSARDQIEHLTDIVFADMGETQVKNIERPIRVYRVIDGETDRRNSSRSTISRRTAYVLSGALAIVVVLAVAAFLGTELFDSVFLAERSEFDANSSGDPRPLMIVMPFTNVSGDPGQEYFVDGLTEDVTTALARVPGFLVIARNTAFTFKDNAVDVRELEKEFGVRYVLDGSARRSDERLRLNSQLIETATGTHVWAERFDRPMSDLFVVQDELVDRVVGTVAAELRRHEGERALAASPETLKAYDLTVRARALYRDNTKDSVTEARNLLKRAAALDPDFSPAYSQLAKAEMFFFTSRVNDEYAKPETADRVVAAAAKAVRLDPKDAFARAVHGVALRLKNRYDEAELEAKEALKIAPNDPDVLAEVSSVFLGVGDYPRTIDTVNVAQSLDPNISPVFVGAVQAQAYFAIGDYSASKDAAHYCLSRAPQDVRCHESLVRALGELGPPDAAKAARDELLGLSPDYTVSEYQRRAKKNRTDEEAIKRWSEGLRKAGIPE